MRIPSLMVTAAARYAMGNQLAASQPIIDWLERVWSDLDDQTVELLQRDIREENAMHQRFADMGSKGWTFNPAWNTLARKPLPGRTDRVQVFDVPVPNEVVLAAFRYSLGRQSYIVGETTSWLASIRDEVDASVWNAIRRETRAAIDAESAGSPRIDEPAWRRLIDYPLPAAR